MNYRPEIDGLRALAVLPVIFFHAGFSWSKGGFIGVDIFFVISGYLITNIIISEMYEGKFSLLKFYERRSRRILPALFFVMLLSIPFAWYFLPPGSMKDFGQSLSAVSIFSSNFLFWLESDYFAAEAELKPLLHTWSLAIEEQFYILFPILLILIWSFDIKWKIVILGIIFFISLGISHYGAQNFSSANFYLLPSRAWELLLGVFVAIILKHRGHLKSHLSNQTLSLFGLLMISYSIIVFNEDTPFPSLHTLIPTIGTAILIYSAVPNTLANNFLRIRVIVGMGLISYSTYLWHQPIFSFARYALLGDVSNLFLLCLCIISIVLAYLSWKYVEAPFRNKGNFSQKQIFSFSICGIILFFIVGASIHINRGFPERVGFNDELLSSFDMPKEENCFQTPYNHIEKEWGCYLGEKKDDLDFIVYGDSHALALKNVIDDLAKELNVKVFFTGSSACPPLLGIHPKSEKEIQEKNNCFLLNKRVSKFAVKESIKGIILSARWSYYTSEGYKGNDSKYLSMSSTGPFSLDKSIVAFEEGINNTIDFYKKNNISIHILSQPPHQKYLPRSAYVKLLRGSSIELLSVPKAEFEELEFFTNHVFKKKSNEIIFHDLKNVFCNDNTCPLGSKNQSYYFDEDHLSSVGAKKIENVLRSILIFDG